MNRLEINPDNEKYYSKEFIQGYKCGTKNQLDADAKVLKQIRVELEDCIRHSQYFTTVTLNKLFGIIFFVVGVYF